jgi:hypothetical protein
MPPFTALDLRFNDGRNWTLLTHFFYDGPQGSWTVPAGFETDFASIPRVFWRLLPPVGRYGKAAVIHDFLYRTGSASRAVADRVFLDAMEVLGVGWLTRHVMFLAVRAFGWTAYKGK